MESHEPLTASEKSRRGGERLEAQEGFHVPGQDAAALKIEGKCKELNLANNLNEPGSKSPPPPLQLPERNTALPTPLLQPRETQDMESSHALLDF